MDSQRKYTSMMSRGSKNRGEVFAAYIMQFGNPRLGSELFKSHGKTVFDSAGKVEDEKVPNTEE